MRRFGWILSCVALLLSSSAFASGTTLRRFALLIGTNDGGPERIRLRYAVSDAQSFGRVLNELGGLDPADMQLLKEAGRTEVLTAISALANRVQQAKADGVRTEALVYYSGHSDEEGLLLRGELLSYAELRKALEKLPADVRIAVLDSCASGTMARTKGGVRRAPFMVDASTTVRGQAILTSSSGDEASQESDGLGGSYFTHNLVSGLRGAADASHDGRVTLSEAYQFAFDETLARTGSSRAGPQHPSWDIDLVGSGDVVLTDLRTTRAGLRFASDLDGQLFIRDRKDNLIAELHKSKGEVAELAVPLGTYAVLRDEGSSRWRSSVTVASGGRAEVAAQSFTAMPTEMTVSRGGRLDSAGPKYAFVNVSLVPFVATNDLLGGDTDNHVSFGLVAARAGSVNGVALSSVLNLVHRGSNGATVAGAANLVGGSSHGAMLAGGFNGAHGDMHGVLLAGGGNVGLGELTGVQFAGGFNYANRIHGLQTAGGVNIAGELHGLQLSVINVGGEVHGAQIGVINLGSKVHGLQLGVINLGNEVEGASVGVLSFVRNGQFHLEAWSSDISYANVGVKFGSKYAYTILTASALPSAGERSFAFGGGLGAHVPFNGWFVDIDGLATTVLGGVRPWNNGAISIFQLRAMAGIPVAGRFAIIAGPSANVGMDFDEPTVTQLTRLPTWGSDNVRIWPGLQVGVRY